MAPRSNPSIANDNYYDNSDSSHLYAWQTSIRKRYSRGLVTNIHYTWGKTLAYNRGDIGFGGSYIQDFFNIKANKGRPEGDVATISWPILSTRFRFRRPGRREVRIAANGREVSSILAARSGLPLAISEPNGLGSQRPDLTDLEHAVLNSGLQYLNRAAFVPVPVSSVSGATMRPGTLGNGVIGGPGFWNLDASIARVFSFTERYRLRLRADLLNAFNHTNFTSVDTNTQSATFGRLTATAGARRVQFGLRFTF